MAQASTLRPGAVLRVKGDFFKVIESDVHQGGGKTGTMVHAKLRNLATGQVAEPRFEPRAEVDVVALERKKMQYSYKDGEEFVFMDPQSYDQLSIPPAVLGLVARFLKESDVLEVELFEGRPLSVHFPAVVDIVVASTGGGVKGAHKQATLENGVELLVPDFIKQGDRIRVEVETAKYVDRVK